MKNKPDSCKSCPLYGDGKGFVPGVYPKGARVMVVGQNPGADEEKRATPFVGKTGQILRERHLPILGEEKVALDNTIRCRWKPPGARSKTNKLPGGKVLREAIKCCSQYDPNFEQFDLVIAQGAVTLEKFAPGYKLHEWRGFLLPREVENGDNVL